MRNIELLAPAGNFECLKAAVYNGANAVYLGGKNFSARAFANNFDEEELKKAVRFAHLHDVRIFVTLNTLLTEREFANAIKMADFYYENKVDALLIQDLGLYYYLKKKYPDFELHCSTQMHVHNLQGVRNARKLGFSRVVLARESTLDLIKEACKEDIEIETFVHGAICVSYSGQCLMSSSTKNRSAN
ncbi:MAG: U32 family peptidase, partial [Erysipelotrichaceae bacterium]|nr:U32 family peptidase [Erysipelotrichaceae bacterium]